MHHVAKLVPTMHYEGQKTDATLFCQGWLLMPKREMKSTKNNSKYTLISSPGYKHHTQNQHCYHPASVKYLPAGGTIWKNINTLSFVAYMHYERGEIFYTETQEKYRWMFHTGLYFLVFRKRVPQCHTLKYPMTLSKRGLKGNDRQREIRIISV